MQISPVSSTAAPYGSLTIQTPAQAADSQAAPDTVQLSPEAQALLQRNDPDHDGDGH